MKTKLLFIGLLLGAASLTSCKKDWNCDCEYSQDGVTLEGSAEFKDVSKKDAEEACDSFESTSSMAGQSWDCTLSEK